MIELKKNLELKYYLNMHLNSALLEKESILFEIINYILENNTKDKEVTYKNCKFSTKTLKYIFGERFVTDESKDSIIYMIKGLVEDGYIDVNSKTFHISKKGIGKLYNITEKYKA